MKIEFLTPFLKYGRYHELKIKQEENFEDVINTLTKKFGEDFRKLIVEEDNIHEGIMILVNGRNKRFRGICVLLYDYRWIICLGLLENILILI
jgi:hypothetical protein